MGTTAFQRYVETPIQTLDGIIVTQPKRFLPLAQEARKIAEKICIEKINEQWAGLPREQLLNQSFNAQLNSIQILKQLAPLQLAKDHLPGDIRQSRQYPPQPTLLHSRELHRRVL